MDDDIVDGRPAAAEDAPPTAEPATFTLRSSDDATSPIVVDLGRCRRKQIKLLKRGEGPLVKEVDEVIEQVRAALAQDLEGKTLVPLVLIYRQKRKRSRQPTAALFPQP